MVALVLALAAAGGGAWYLVRGSAPAKPTSHSTYIRPGQLRPVTAAQWLAAAGRAATEATSVHITDVDRLARGTATFSDDDGRTTGRQIITPGPGMRAEVRVIGTSTYFTGNAATLTNFFGFRADQAARLRGHWLVLHPGDPQYDTVTEGVTLSSAIKELRMPTPMTLLPEQRVGGVEAVGIRGTGRVTGAPGPVTATLWIDAETMRPVRYEARSGNLTETTTLTKWDVPFTVVAPADALSPVAGTNA